VPPPGDQVEHVDLLLGGRARRALVLLQGLRGSIDRLGGARKLLRRFLFAF